MNQILAWIALLLSNSPAAMPVGDVPTVPQLVVQSNQRSLSAVQVAPDIFVVPGQDDVRWAGTDAVLVGRDLVNGVQFVKIPDVPGVAVPSVGETVPAVGSEVFFSGAQTAGKVRRTEADKFWVECENSEVRPGTPVMCKHGDWRGIVVGADPVSDQIEVLDATAIRESFDENWSE